MKNLPINDRHPSGENTLELPHKIDAKDIARLAFKYNGLGQGLQISPRYNPEAKPLVNTLFGSPEEQVVEFRFGK